MKKMQQPVISLIMPVFNAKEPEFRQAIESILNQTFEDFEFIIINDGSTNNSEEVALSYSDKRIRYIKNDYNMKLIKTLNKGLGLANGKYIARLDSDDFCDKTRFEKQVNYLENNPNVGLLGTFITIEPTGEKTPLFTDPKEIKILMRYGHNCLAHSSVMFRKSVIDKYNLKYGEYCIYAEDYKLWTEMSLYCDITNLPEYLVSYRLSNDGICATHTAEQQKMTNLIILDNIIQDFECNKDFMYSILTKYAKNIQLSKLEYYAAEALLLQVIKYIKANVGENRGQGAVRRLVWILKEMNTPKRN